MIEALKMSDSRLRTTQHPIVYEVNSRVLVNELSVSAGRKITLETIPESLLDKWANIGFDAVWLMGVWSTGPMGREIARDHPGLQNEYRTALPDLRNEDVIGSPYAVRSYDVAPSLGGASALASLRKRLIDRGLGLILDVVSNHTARDHRWVAGNPGFYIQGVDGDETAKPDMYFRVATDEGEKVLAFGRDPYFSGWTDTAQLNYFNPELRVAMITVLKKISGMCDGVRCDMAMLTLNKTFEQTWGGAIGGYDRLADEFWETAIDEVRKEHPNFVFIAEAYWELGWPLQRLGFDYTYDKRLYDRLLFEGAVSVQEHLRGDIEYQRRLVRFIENHDEQRAAKTLPSPQWHCAAATVAATLPGMLLLHEGQLEGRVVRVPVQLARRPEESASPVMESFYSNLLKSLQSAPFRSGSWEVLTPRPAWHENSSWENFLCFWWAFENDRRLIIVNYSPNNGQCYVPLPLSEQAGMTIEFQDLMGSATYYREASSLCSKGMFFDLSGYSFHLFKVRPSS